jgi:hypothetical protein
MLTLDYVQDPGRGWIAADRQMLRFLGLLEVTSSYSYQDDDLIWLEEDCDGPRFLSALSRVGIDYQLVDTHTRGNAWIRNLPQYQP